MVEKFVLQLEAQLADRDVHHRADATRPRAWLAEKGYDEHYGRAAAGAA